MIMLRFQSSQPKAVRETLLSLDPRYRRFLGLPDHPNALWDLFSFPVLGGRAIFVDIAIEPAYRSAWLGWLQHAASCGLITHLPDIIEQATQEEESE